jgi:hypothetical protein
MGRVSKARNVKIDTSARQFGGTKYEPFLIASSALVTEKP